jgi:hypothetical protein
MGRINQNTVETLVVEKSFILTELVHQVDNTVVIGQIVDVRSSEDTSLMDVVLQSRSSTLNPDVSKIIMDTLLFSLDFVVRQLFSRITPPVSETDIDLILVNASDPTKVDFVLKPVETTLNANP